MGYCNTETAQPKRYHWKSFRCVPQKKLAKIKSLNDLHGYDELREADKAFVRNAYINALEHSEDGEEQSDSDISVISGREDEPENDYGVLAVWFCSIHN